MQGFMYFRDMSSINDAFFQKPQRWQFELLALRNILLSESLQESIKWGTPCYSWEDKNIVILGPFKHYVTLGFFKGALLSDTLNLLVKPGEHSQAGRQLRVESVEEIKQKEVIILQYLQQAIQVEQKGIEFVPTEMNLGIFPEEWASRLAATPALAKAFHQLTPGRQRAYQIFFSAPQQAATRERRIDKMVPLILSGKGINDCTCGLSNKMPYCDGSHKQLRKQ
jgi:uncharacterized protein YdeI (YjbR/CyaY-like superfamily)